MAAHQPCKINNTEDEFVVRYVFTLLYVNHSIFFIILLAGWKWEKYSPHLLPKYGGRWRGNTNIHSLVVIKSFTCPKIKEKMKKEKRDLLVIIKTISYIIISISWNWGCYAVLIHVTSFPRSHLITPCLLLNLPLVNSSSDSTEFTFHKTQYSYS